MKRLSSCRLARLPRVPILLVLGLLIFCGPQAQGSAVAGSTTDSTDPAIDGGESYFSNPAQVAHAEALARADAEKNDPAVAAAHDDVETAEQALAEAELSEDPAAIAAAEKALAESEAALASALATATASSVQEVAQLRASGLGWGQIAQQLGVPPGTLGRGRRQAVSGELGDTAQTKVRDQTRERLRTRDLDHAAPAPVATARNLRTGWHRELGSTDPQAVGNMNANHVNSSVKNQLKNQTAFGDDTSTASASQAGAGNSSGKSGSAGDGSGKGNGNDGGSGKSGGDNGGGKSGGDNGGGKSGGDNGGGKSGGDKGGGNSGGKGGDKGNNGKGKN